MRPGSQGPLGPALNPTPPDFGEQLTTDILVESAAVTRSKSYTAFFYHLLPLPRHTVCMTDSYRPTLVISWTKMLTNRHYYRLFNSYFLNIAACAVCHQLSKDMMMIGRIFGFMPFLGDD